MLIELNFFLYFRTHVFGDFFHLNKNIIYRDYHSI